MGQGQKLYLWRVSGRGWIPEDLSALVLVLNRMGKKLSENGLVPVGRIELPTKGL